nr:ATP-binding protein [Gemmatimonadaceae bacterium]
TVYLSARAASILGQGETDQVHPGGAMHALLHPDDVGEWHARMRAHFKHRTPYRQELRLRRPDGLWQWVAARGEATFAGDRAVRMAGTLSDIQARKEAEQRLVESERRLALAMRATSDGVIEFVVGHDHAWCSARTAAILELEEIPDGGVVPWTRVIVGQPPSEVVRQQAALASSLATGAVYDVTIQRQRLDGSTQWLRVRGFPDRTTEGADVRFVASISDITADVAAQVALRASEARLWQAQKMDALGTLASGIAHDFNNLLAVILGYVEVGLAGQPTGLADRALREIGVAGRRARDLVGQMLSFSRQSESAGAIGGPGAAVAAAIEETTHYVAATKTPQVAVTVTIADDVPPVAVDDSALQQVLLNLAMNGVHAMRERGGVLTLGADIVATDDPLDGGSRELSPGRYVRLRVSDTGCGIPPELLDRVVEPFFTTKSHGEGTGLGLSVVHGVVSSSGGAMRIRSAVGAGTTVELLLPVAAGVADERPMPTTDPFGAPIDGHVLVVDDDPAVADVTAERLRLAGCRVTVRLDAASALEVLAAIDANEGRERHDAGPDPVHLVLADWSMPEHSGEWLLARIRERWPALPVALMSGHRSAEGTARVLAAGGVALLEKPVEPAALAAVLRRHGTPTADTAAAGA